jgi:site-specific DNA-methyltransferase (adenine-specific)
MSKTHNMTTTIEYTDQITMLPVEQLNSHPKNPRLVIREDVIDSIRAGLKGGFQPCYALQVWRGFVLSGHHRLEAAKREGITEVPCFVRDDLSEDEAYMVLATANAQGELSPLEIGMHALHYVDKATGGRGKKGGLSAYAEAVGKSESLLRHNRDAAKVVQNLAINCDLSAYLDKAAHLAAIHKLPPSWWAVAAAHMMRGNKSAKDTGAFVDNWKQCAEAVAGTGWLEGMSGDGPVLARMLHDDKITLTTIRKCLGTLEDIKTLTQKNGIDTARVDEFLNTTPTTHREFVEFQQELLASLFESKSTWNHGRWQDHIDTLEDGSVSLVLTDPPYGMEYRSNHRKVRHDSIDGDDSTDAFRESVEAMIPKMKDNAHLLAFVNWKNEAEFIRACEGCGLTVKSSIVWVKNNTGMGDLNGAFAPKHERIIHAVKGSPKLFIRAADVLAFDRVATENHPTEKPVDLLATLIEACTVKGQLVADPFGGVASVAIAAKASGRDYWSCETNDKYFRYGQGRIEE